MKFKIETVDSELAEVVIHNYPCLKDFNYETTIETRGEGTRHECTVEIPYISINSIEELVKLQKAVHYPLIMKNNFIEIYDGYRE